MTSQIADETSYQQTLDRLERRVCELERGDEGFWSSAAMTLSFVAAMWWFWSAASQKSALTIAAFPAWAQLLNAASANANVVAAALSGLAALAAAMSSRRGSTHRQ